jgi:hypothetical protein
VAWGGSDQGHGGARELMAVALECSLEQSGREALVCGFR